jgi:hypothetical protein
MAKLHEMQIGVIIGGMTLRSCTNIHGQLPSPYRAEVWISLSLSYAIISLS